MESYYIYCNEEVSPRKEALLGDGCNNWQHWRCIELSLDLKSSCVAVPLLSNYRQHLLNVVNLPVVCCNSSALITFVYVNCLSSNHFTITAPFLARSLANFYRQ